MKIIDIAKSQVGYLEKKSAAYEDEMTTNAGSNNYTKYGKWYGLDGQPWCDMFVSWCADQAGCSDVVGKFAYCPSHVNWFKSQGRWHNRAGYTPAVGDIIFFTTDGDEACHVGIVYYVDSSMVYTIEGNTSNSAALVSNGGACATKKYSRSSTYILGYGHPAYDGGTSTAAETETEDTEVKAYHNGSTEEPVYQTTDCSNQIGSLDPWEECSAYAKINGVYLVSYRINGTSMYKTGFVKYDGNCGL